MPGYDARTCHEVVNTFIRCYKGAWMTFQDLYKGSKWTLAQMFRDNQERWNHFKKVIKFIHYVKLLPPRNVRWDARIWKEKITGFVTAGYPMHMTTTSGAEKTLVAAERAVKVRSPPAECQN